MNIKQKFEAIRIEADEMAVWKFDRCQAAIDALDAQLPDGWQDLEDEGTLTPQQQSTVTERARQLGMQYQLYEGVAVPINGDVTAALAYKEFEDENPPPDSEVADPRV